jgi:hypothetical protein
MGEVSRIRERVKDLRGRSLDEGGEANLRGRGGLVVGAHAISSAFRDRLQVSEAHPPHILDRPAGRVMDWQTAVLRPEHGRPFGAIIEIVRNAGFDTADGPTEGEAPQDLAFVDRRLPPSAFRRDETSLASELETPSHFRLDAGPPTEPSRKMLDPQEALENGRSGGPNSH